MSTTTTTTPSLKQVPEAATPEQGCAIGSDATKAEITRRRNYDLCLHCGERDHIKTDCKFFWQENRLQQSRAIGRDACGFEKTRRRKAGLCLFCGSAEHIKKTCPAFARVQAELIMKRSNQTLRTHKERHAAWEKRVAVENAAKEEKSE